MTTKANPGARKLTGGRPKEPEHWEDDDSHLFLHHVNLHVKMDATVCLRCYKQFEDCHEGETCESQKDGGWTTIGIEAILTTLREGDDREITLIPGEAAQIIAQLQATIAKSESQPQSRLLIEEAVRRLTSEAHKREPDGSVIMDVVRGLEEALKASPTASGAEAKD